jgi:hypothetical protein
MIRAVAAASEVTLDGELESGTRVYFDADWIPRDGSAELPVITAASVAEAAAVFGALVDEVLEALAGISAEAVEVTGRGIVAGELRRRLGISAAPPRPSAVVETTGDPQAIEAATRRLADLGTLILAGEPSGRRLDLDLYRDVHARGLRVVGVARAAGGSPVALPNPVAVRTGEPLPDGAEWFELST